MFIGPRDSLSDLRRTAFPGDKAFLGHPVTEMIERSQEVRRRSLAGTLGHPKVAIEHRESTIGDNVLEAKEISV